MFSCRNPAVSISFQCVPQIMDKVAKSNHYCCVCHKNSRHGKNLSFFRFPKDVKRFEQWRDILQVDKISLHSAQYCYDHFRICSMHFEDKMFAGMSKSRLKKYAIPSQIPKEVFEGLFVCPKVEVSATGHSDEDVGETCSVD